MTDPIDVFYISSTYNERSFENKYLELTITEADFNDNGELVGSERIRCEYILYDDHWQEVYQLLSEDQDLNDFDIRMVFPSNESQSYMLSPLAQLAFELAVFSFMYDQHEGSYIPFTLVGEGSDQSLAS